MDLTLDCNLRCTYCFKEKANGHMEERVAFDAVVWLLYASGHSMDLRVNFMGGEPLLRLPLIERLVPFAKRRAWQVGKSIHFAATTNGTLVTEDVIALWRTWGMGFHSSIDGAPETQDHNRPAANGEGSSHLVARSVPRILEYNRDVMARATVTPDTAGAIGRDYAYFRSLGYVNMGFVPAGPASWTEDAMALFADQYWQLGERVIDGFRRGLTIRVSGIDGAIQAIVRNKRPEHACGAGRGTVLIDIHGDIWPCHRWNKESEGRWRIGNIYEQFDDNVRGELDVASQTAGMRVDCNGCIAGMFCGGGCLAENLEETGQPYVRCHNACEFTRVFVRVGQKVHDVLYGEKNVVFLRQYYSTPSCGD
jgi:uncharacterized protein